MERWHVIQHIHHLETLTLCDRFLKIVSTEWRRKEENSLRQIQFRLHSIQTWQMMKFTELKARLHISLKVMEVLAPAAKKHLQDERKTSTEKVSLQKTTRKNSH